MTMSRWVLMVFLGEVACAPASATEPPASAVANVEAPAPTDASASGSASTASITIAVPETVAVWAPQILEAAGHHGVEPDLVALVVWLESGGHADARSPAGALGLMQMMPATAAAVAGRRGEPPPPEAELLEPERNLDLGCAHLAELAAELAPDDLDADAVHRIAVAYNGGHRVLERWLDGEPLPEETRRYAATMRERWETR